MSDVFSRVEILRIFEIAQEALKNADFFDDSCFNMELSDKDMQALRDKLSEYMESDKAYIDA